MYKVRGLGHAALMGAVWMTSLARFACSEDFSDCDSTRTCPSDLKDGGPDAARGGTGGTGASSGGTGGREGDGGTAGTAGDASTGDMTGGTTGMAGAAGMAGDAGPDPRCGEGWLDCNEDLSDGCEVDPNTDVDHCGGCDSACAEAGVAERTCEAGECVPTCTDGFVDCDEDGRNGCEIDTRTDVANCGACNRACSTANTSAVSCAAGACAPTCTANFGDCTKPQAPAADNGCETNVTTAQNCGTCGRNCQGGTCDAQRACTPVVLGYPEYRPVRMTVDSQYAFWHVVTPSGFAIVRAGANGGGRTQVHSTNGLFFDIASDGQWAYFTRSYSRTESGVSANYSGIFRMNRASGAVTTWTERPWSELIAMQLIVTNEAIFWSSRIAPNTGSLWKSGKASGADADSFAPLSGLTWHLLADSSHVYAATDVGIERVTSAGGMTDTFVPAPMESVQAMAMDSTHVYFADEEGIKRKAKGTAQPQLVRERPGNDITAVAVSPTRVFFLDSLGLFSLPKTGTQAPVKIADTDENPLQLIYFDGALYWTALGPDTPGTNGRVMKIVP